MTSPLPVDYGTHDAAYRKLREQGAIGWSSDQDYVDMLAVIAPALPPAGPDSSPRVLEIGCGAGNLSILLAQRGYCVTGVDIAATAIDWANGRPRESGTNALFRVDNVVTLSSCGDAVFDAVVDGHCLHCIIGDDRARCLAAVRRVLKPGGVFVLLSMCGEVRDEKRLGQFDPVTQVLAVDGRPTRYIGSADAIVAEVRRAGFEIATVHVNARGSIAEQDDLVIHATTPAAAQQQGGAHAEQVKTDT